MFKIRNDKKEELKNKLQKITNHKIELLDVIKHIPTSEIF